MNFGEKVWKVVKRIPLGKVLTYKKLAGLAGNSKAVRAVGNILNKNRHLGIVPCHRVIRTNGLIGGYQKGTKIKKKLLLAEGIIIKNNTIDLTKYLWKNVQK